MWSRLISSLVVLLACLKEAEAVPPAPSECTWVLSHSSCACSQNDDANQPQPWPSHDTIGEAQTYASNACPTKTFMYSSTNPTWATRCCAVPNDPCAGPGTNSNWDVWHYHCEACDYSEEACRITASNQGLQLGGGGFSFAGDYSETGCYAYSSGTFSGSAFYGYADSGGEVVSSSQLTDITASEKYRICAQAPLILCTGEYVEFAVDKVCDVSDQIYAGQSNTAVGVFANQASCESQCAPDVNPECEFYFYKDDPAADPAASGYRYECQLYKQCSGVQILPSSSGSKICQKACIERQEVLTTSIMDTYCGHDTVYTVDRSPSPKVCHAEYTANIQKALANGMFGLKADPTQDRNCNANCLYDADEPSIQAYVWNGGQGCWLFDSSNTCTDGGTEFERAIDRVTQFCPATTCPQMYPSCGKVGGMVGNCRIASCSGDACSHSWSLAPGPHTAPRGLFNYVLGVDGIGSACTGDFEANYYMVETNGKCTDTPGCDYFTDWGECLAQAAIFFPGVSHVNPFCDAAQLPGCFKFGNVKMNTCGSAVPSSGDHCSTHNCTCKCSITTTPKACKTGPSSGYHGYAKGGIIRASGADSASACKAICETHPECGVFDYHVDTGECELKCPVGAVCASSSTEPTQRTSLAADSIVGPTTCQACATDTCSVLHQDSIEQCAEEPVCTDDTCCSYRPGCQSCCSGGYLDMNCCPAGHGSCEAEPCVHIAGNYVVNHGGTLTIAQTGCSSFTISDGELRSLIIVGNAMTTPGSKEYGIVTTTADRWHIKWSSDGTEFTQAANYIGCFQHSLGAVTSQDYEGNGDGATWEECQNQARNDGFSWFALECPTCYSTVGVAKCLYGGDYTQEGQTMNADCEDEYSSDGHRLGGTSTIAVYRVQAAYSENPANANVCQQGMAKITNQYVCQSAAAELGLSFRPATASYYGSIPGGCSRFTAGDRVFHNPMAGAAHPDYAPLCQAVLYHLAPPGYASCDVGDSASLVDCASAAQSVGIAMSQTLKVGPEDGEVVTCLDNGWGGVPGGCSVQTGVPGQTLYKIGQATTQGCVHATYQLVCTGQGFPDWFVREDKCFIEYCNHYEDLQKRFCCPDGVAMNTLSNGSRYCTVPTECSVSNVDHKRLCKAHAERDVSLTAAKYLKQGMLSEACDNTVTTTTIATTAASTVERKSFKGEIRMNVPKRSKFLAETNLISVLTDAIAELLEVVRSWIHNVRCVPAPGTRRLLADSLTVKYTPRRFLADDDDAGDVEVDWTIEIPPEEGEDIVVTVFAERFNSKAISEVTETVNTFVNSGALGENYDVNVTWLYVIPEEPTPDQETTTSDEGTSPIIFVIAGLGVLSGFFLIGLVLIYWHYGRKTRSIAPKRKLDTQILRAGVKGGGAMATCTLQELLSPPDEISTDKGKELRGMMRSLCDNASLSACKVFLTYAPGTRDGDAEGYGPGSFYAAAVSKVLHDQGVWCFSDLMLPDNYQREHFDLALSSTLSAEVLVVVQTEGLYQSREALTQIYLAQQLKLKVIPLRFEDDLPKAEDTWTSITREDLEGMLMVSAVHSVYMKLNSIPSPPYTVPTQPFILKDFVQDLRRDLVLEDGKVIDNNDENNCPGSNMQEKHPEDSMKLLDHVDEGVIYGNSSIDIEAVRKEPVETKQSVGSVGVRSSNGGSEKGAQMSSITPSLAAASTASTTIPRSRSNSKDNFKGTRSEPLGKQRDRARSAPTKSTNPSDEPKAKHRSDMTAMKSHRSDNVTGMRSLDTKSQDGYKKRHGSDTAGGSSSRRREKGDFGPSQSSKSRSRSEEVLGKRKKKSSDSGSPRKKDSNAV